MNSDAESASVQQMAALVDGGAIPPDQLARAALARIAAADAEFGAFVCTQDPTAVAAQARWFRGPLAGVPVAVKDIFDTRDLPTSYGSPIYGGPLGSGPIGSGPIDASPIDGNPLGSGPIDESPIDGGPIRGDGTRAARPARCDAAVVSALRAAGGVVIGKSTTTEFAHLHPTATRNPRAPGRTPGGSSAGSAAAVAAGLVRLAIGTQTGGSVIRPASYCGVVGYKPSFGWLPTAGLKCFSWSLDTVGLFARDVDDVAWCAQALCGRALVADAANGRRLAADAVDTMPPFVVGVPDTYPWGEPSPSARNALAVARDALRAAGIEARPCALPPWAAAAFEAHTAIQGFEAWRSLSWEFGEHGEQLSAQLRAYLQGAGDVSAGAYEAAQRVATQARAEAQAWMRRFDALLTPSAPDEAPLGHASTGAATFNRAWTLLGVPCVNVPGVLGEHGAPMGLQLIAPHGADARLLAVARRLEQALGSQLASRAPHAR